MTWVTPSPESRTIPVDFPVANLNYFWITKKELPGLPRRLPGLGTFKKIFPPFSFYAWWDSYWLQ